MMTVVVVAIVVVEIKKNKHLYSTCYVLDNVLRAFYIIIYLNLILCGSCIYLHCRGEGAETGRSHG